MASFHTGSKAPPFPKILIETLINPSEDWKIPITAISRKLRNLLPSPVKSVLRPFWRAANVLAYRLTYGFFPPPAGTDLVGYETLIEFLRVKGTLGVPGDVVEIGAFCGGGTYKLARSLLRKRLRKQIFAVDCFDVTVDTTKSTDSITMADLYAGNLRGRSQRAFFDKVTRGLPNIVVIAADSKTVSLPTDALCFAFVDGNHSPEYVRSDFRLVWDKLSPGGAVAFHDYGHDLPGVTSTLDDLCAEHRNEIKESFVDVQKHILFLQKRPE